MKKSAVIIAVIAASLFSVASASGSGKIAPCSLAPASTASQARIQATCVRGARTMRQRAEGWGGATWRIRVETNACQPVTFDEFRCRFSGFIGEIGCRGVVRTHGVSKDPAEQRARLTYFACAR